MVEVNIISFSDDGHRAVFNSVIIKALAPYGFRLEFNNSSARIDFFPMLDDNIGHFVWSVLVNALIGKRTTGLFFRPGECFRVDKLKYRLKRIIFKVLKHVPRTTIFTIIPFSAEPQFQQIANGYINDPQLWDLKYFALSGEGAFPELAARIRRESAGRTIVMALGTQTEAKGFNSFVDIWCNNLEIRRRFLFVAAGKVAQSCMVSAENFQKMNGLLMDRVVSDPELLYLYSVADIVWSCYLPNYNQGSGIFSRAFQFGKPAIVREGSFLSRIAAELTHPTLRVPVDHVNAASLLLAWRPESTDKDVRLAKTSQIRTADLNILARSFGKGDASSVDEIESSVA